MTPAKLIRLSGALGLAAGFGGRRVVAILFAAPADEIRSREQLSCARLGFDPGGGGFTSCDTSLDAALSAADTPQS